MLILLATNESNTLPVYAGEIKEILLPKEMINAKWEVQSPSGNKRLLIPDYNREKIIIDQTNELGSYEVYGNDELVTAFSTMLEKKERPIRRIPGQTLVDIFGNNQAQYIEPREKIADTLIEIRYGKALWRHFLIAAIILILAEMIIGKPNLLAMKSDRK